MQWTAPQKPAEFAENQLINAILEGHFPIGTVLPAERELAAQLGVTRPTLREVLQRLARDGWLEIRHGKATRVRDYWQEGSLGVLGALAQRSEAIPEDFVPNLLAVRMALAPAYIRLAVENQPMAAAAQLSSHTTLPESPAGAAAFAAFDWQLHHRFTVLSGNPIFTLILNGFCDLYQPMATRYFRSAEARASSRQFYAGLHRAASQGDAAEAEAITRQVMNDSLRLWQIATA
jgi:GntR family transcriptional regulator, negative regulator for fad regulon and positive regulator of fabA